MRNSQKNLLIIFLICLIIFGFWGWRYSRIKNHLTVCTKEVKICPDGSTVGREGPNCEFAPCPNQ